jgi:epoxyqueuosine reductase
LTIELRDSIPRELRAGMGAWVFGCDICQEVCPWNHKAPRTTEPVFQPASDLAPAEAAELLELSDIEFQERFQGTPLTRPKRAGLLRNAAIVLGNGGDRTAVPFLVKALWDPEPLIREACAWALGRLRGRAAEAALRERLEIEELDLVRTELEQALAGCEVNPAP